MEGPDALVLFAFAPVKSPVALPADAFQSGRRPAIPSCGDRCSRPAGSVRCNGSLAFTPPRDRSEGEGVAMIRAPRRWIVRYRKTAKSRWRRIPRFITPATGFRSKACSEPEAGRAEATGASAVTSLPRIGFLGPQHSRRPRKLLRRAGAWREQSQGGRRAEIIHCEPGRARRAVVWGLAAWMRRRGRVARGHAIVGGGSSAGRGRWCSRDREAFRGRQGISFGSRSLNVGILERTFVGRGKRDGSSSRRATRPTVGRMVSVKGRRAWSRAAYD